jgi:hypothetical protein
MTMSGGSDKSIDGRGDSSDHRRQQRDWLETLKAALETGHSVRAVARSAQHRNRLSGQLLFEDRPEVFELVEEVPDVIAGALLPVGM